MFALACYAVAVGPHSHAAGGASYIVGTGGLMHKVGGLSCTRVIAGLSGSVRVCWSVNAYAPVVGHRSSCTSVASQLLPWVAMPSVTMLTVGHTQVPWEWPDGCFPPAGASGACCPVICFSPTHGGLLPQLASLQVYCHVA
jgi:hypothetical protein